MGQIASDVRTVHKTSTRTLLACAALTAAALVTPANAQNFKGKTITILTGYSAGSSVSVAARAFAKHFKKNIPGNPNVIVKIMAGGGGVKAQNFFSEKSKPDGTTLYFGPLAVVGKAIGRKEVRADYGKFGYVGGFGVSLVTFGRTDVFEKFDLDKGMIKAKGKMRVGGTRPMSNLSVIHRLAFDLLDLKYSFVPGFRGSDKSLRGLLQSEIHSYTAPEDAYTKLIVPAMVKPGKGAGYFQYARMDIDGKPVKAKNTAGVPYFRDVYKKAKGKDIAGPRWEAMKWISTYVSNLVYSMYTPPGTSADTVKALRTAFAATMQDKDYLAFHVKRFGGAPNLADLKVAENFFDSFANSNPDVVKVLKAFQAQVAKKKKK